MTFKYRLVLYTALLILLGAIAPLTHAQTVTEQAAVEFTVPTANVDGSGITGPLTYNVYAGPKAGPFTKLVSGASTAACPVGVTASATQACLAPFTTTAAAPCLTLTAVESGNESMPSNTACVLQPVGPGGLTVTVIISIH